MDENIYRIYLWMNKAQTKYVVGMVLLKSLSKHDNFLYLSVLVDFLHVPWVHVGTSL